MPSSKTNMSFSSAHLDHLGRDETAEGDGIYNGALDNASGSAIMLEIARSMSAMSPRPRRSILFISVTGEELGLLGSDYFANNPTVPKASLAANINTDEDQMLWPLQGRGRLWRRSFQPGSRGKIRGCEIASERQPGPRARAGQLRAQRSVLLRQAGSAVGSTHSGF